MIKNCYELLNIFNLGFKLSKKIDNLFYKSSDNINKIFSINQIKRSFIKLENQTKIKQSDHTIRTS
jgi:hypothetical protein